MASTLVLKQNSPDKAGSGYQQALENFTQHFGLETALTLMTEFVNAMKEVLPELEDSVPSKDITRVMPLTHRLIGLCPIYKAGHLADIGQAMEREMARGDWQAVEEHSSQLSPAFSLYMGRLSEPKKMDGMNRIRSIIPAANC